MRPFLDNTCPSSKCWSQSSASSRIINNNFFLTLGPGPKLQKVEGLTDHDVGSPSIFTFLLFYLFTFSYIPMQDVAPSAVRMADAIDAIICTTHFKVSFLVIRF